MPDQPAIFGSRTFQGPGTGGGEGPWYWLSGGYGSPSIVTGGMTGDSLILWLDLSNGFTVVSGPVAERTGLADGVMVVLDFTSSGTVTVSLGNSCSLGYALAHLVKGGVG